MSVPIESSRTFLCVVEGFKRAFHEKNDSTMAVCVTTQIIFPPPVCADVGADKAPATIHHPERCKIFRPNTKASSGGDKKRAHSSQLVITTAEEKNVFHRSEREKFIDSRGRLIDA
jgi:hypothetical protein